MFRIITTIQACVRDPFQFPVWPPRAGYSKKVKYPPLFLSIILPISIVRYDIYENNVLDYK